MLVRDLDLDLAKNMEKVQKMPAKGAREARPFVAEAIFCTFSIFCAIFPKNGPGSFPHLKVPSGSNGHRHKDLARSFEDWQGP